MKKIILLLGLVGMMACKPEESTINYLDYTKEFSTYYEDQRTRGIQVKGKITNTSDEIIYNPIPKLRIWLKGDKEEYSINRGTLCEFLLTEKSSVGTYNTFPLNGRDSIEADETLFYLSKSDPLPWDAEKVNARLEWETQ